MSDLSELLRQYNDVLMEMDQLQEKKKQLREAIAAHVQPGSTTSLDIGDIELQATVRSSVRIQYNEEGLRQRLGDRFRLVLAPDAKKMRQHLSEIRSVLDPFLDQIGSVSRDLVAEHVKAGHLSVQDFSGLYTKEKKDTLFIRRIPKKIKDVDVLD